MSAFAILWFVLIAVLMSGYFILDGFDLGVGVLYPFLGKTDQDKAVMRRAIGPVWDGNEVWLLTCGGALFAAFPAAYATSFSGFYLAIMLVLFALIIRAVAIEFRGADTEHAKVWDVCFFIGSLLPALLFGVAVGNIYAGIPMDAAGNYTGIPLLGLVTPFTLLCGLLGLAMFVAAGASWISLKAPFGSQIHGRAVNMRFIAQIAVVVLYALVSIYGHFIIHPAMAPELTAVRWACVVVFILAMAIAIAYGRNGDRDLRTFICQSLAAVALVFLLATSMFPNLVMASATSVGPSITVATAASSDTALSWMTGIACIGVPLVLVYHVFTYRAFRGRLEVKEPKE